MLLALPPFAKNKGNLLLTRDQPIPAEVVLPSLGEEYVCLIQQENAVPPVRQCKVRLQGGLHVFGICPEITFESKKISWKILPPAEACFLKS